MAGTDKNKMDPTYNARMLKEKKVIFEILMFSSS